jgi:hypothetical protein
MYLPPPPPAAQNKQKQHHFQVYYVTYFNENIKQDLTLINFGSERRAFSTSGHFKLYMFEA